MSTRICGLFVALIWFACSASGFFYVYLLLTFYIFAPIPVVINFRENRVAVISGSLASVAFLTGGIGVLMRRPWARGLSFLLCGLGVFYAVGQILVRETFSLHLQPIVVAPLAAVLLSISIWLFSRSGRTYFRQAVQPE